MYAFITGKIIEKNPAYIVLENNGIGYLINITLNTFSALENETQAKLFTYLSIREDAHILYGFSDVQEKNLFLQLITVSGVGCNTARLILSSLTVSETIDAILNGQQKVIQSVKGIGAKTAQRIIIDLQDKVAKVNGAAEKSIVTNNTIKEEALSALLVLGFNKANIEKTIDYLLKELNSPSVELLIKEALKVL